MLRDAGNLRRTTAGVIRRQPGLAALPRTMAVLLSAWLIYFFAINLFVAAQCDHGALCGGPAGRLSGGAGGGAGIRRRRLPAYKGARFARPRAALARRLPCCRRGSRQSWLAQARGRVDPPEAGHSCCRPPGSADAGCAAPPLLNPTKLGSALFLRVALNARHQLDEAMP